MFVYCAYILKFRILLSQKVLFVSQKKHPPSMKKSMKGDVNIRKLMYKF